MELLNSSWLIHLIEDSDKKPTEKLLSLYSLIETWLHAPGIREGIAKDHQSDQPLANTCPALTAHLVFLATEAKLKNPMVVVSQMMILLQGAMAVELRNPGMGALRSAQEAAKSVLKQARPPMLARVDRAIKTSGYAASFVAAGILGVHLWSSHNAVPIHQAQYETTYEHAYYVSEIEPELLLKALALKKSMEMGTCPAPNFFSLPQEQVPVYLDVVNSQVSGNPNLDNKRLAKFLAWYDQHRAWECYSKAQNKQRTILGMGV